MWAGNPWIYHLNFCHKSSEEPMNDFKQWSDILRMIFVDHVDSTWYRCEVRDQELVEGNVHLFSQVIFTESYKYSWSVSVVLGAWFFQKVYSYDGRRETGVWINCADTCILWKVLALLLGWWGGRGVKNLITNKNRLQVFCYTHLLNGMIYFCNGF
jgi:hypothetical protein